MDFLKTVFAAGALAAGSLAYAEEADPFLWLEEVEGEDAIAWVKEQNASTLTPLTEHPLFDAMYAEAKTILTSDARIPYGQIHAGKVYNFWQDDVNKRGLWRRATIKSFKSGAPEWDVVIDYDALAKKEDRNWIRGSVVCLNPDYVHCMVELSDGGKDAGIWREFNTKTKSFVDGGFFVPEAKSSVEWLDENTLLVGTDRGEGTLTTSGYARTIVKWSRGAALADAPMILEGESGDVSIVASVEPEKDKAHVFGIRLPSFFERIYYYQQADGSFSELPFPRNADFSGVLDGQAIVFLREAWDAGEAQYPLGSIIAYHLGTGATELVMASESNQSIEDVNVGKSNLIVEYLEDVAGKAARLKRGRDGTWRRSEIALPDAGVVSAVSTGGGVDDAMFSFESLTTPDSLYFVSARDKVSKIASLPEFYDASDVEVRQDFATSADGTKVPYFIMGKKSVLEAGDAPTVQYGYGGFLSAILPNYYQDPSRPQHGALAGAMWVSRGGVLVLSNIRGGSEYGPQWHQAALKENRQRSFDDFIAISERLIETGVTSPEKLGIVGRSNGGLLMGAMLTQRPDLYAAIDIGVPLFDMKRYNKLLAGASWMGEYGNPDKPEEWAYISQYSPYQLLKADAGYPKVLFYTSTKDDRVHPGHARKAAAKLKQLGYDYFYYENIEGGHGGTANQDQLAYRTALEYVYFAHQLMKEREGDE